MASKISVISSAFILLGKDPVTTIDPASSTTEVKTASFLYDQWYPKVLGDYPWRFANVTSELSQLTFTPSVPRFKFYYQLPTSPIYVTALRANNGASYEIYQNVLATNENKVLLEYIGVVGEEFWTPNFNIVMINTMASVLAMPVTQDITIAAKFEQLALSSFNDAKVIDAQSRTNNVILDDPFINAHYSGSSVFGGAGRGCR